MNEYAVTYLAFAFIQGVITTRILKENGLFVIAMMIFAPVVTIIWVLVTVYIALEFLVTVGRD